MRLALISDTHGFHGRLAVPPCDVLVHAGDFSAGRGGRHDLEAFLDWFGSQVAAHKILVAGNHDFYCHDDAVGCRRLCERQGVAYLQDEEASIGGLRVWGSPWQPEFGRWAFNLPRGIPLAAKWALIPAGIDLLITHGPPFGILDQTSRGQRVGCEALRLEFGRIRPRAHVFGHIHEDAGRREIEGCSFINASSWEFGQALRPPQLLEL